jgi:hypothetical protein
MRAGAGLKARNVRCVSACAARKARCASETSRCCATTASAGPGRRGGGPAAAAAPSRAATPGAASIACGTARGASCGGSAVDGVRARRGFGPGAARGGQRPSQARAEPDQFLISTSLYLTLLILILHYYTPCLPLSPLILLFLLNSPSIPLTFPITLPLTPIIYHSPFFLLFIHIPYFYLNLPYPYSYFLLLNLQSSLFPNLILIIISPLLPSSLHFYSLSIYSSLLFSLPSPLPYHFLPC